MAFMQSQPVSMFRGSSFPLRFLINHLPIDCRRTNPARSSNPGDPLRGYLAKFTKSGILLRLSLILAVEPFWISFYAFYRRHCPAGCCYLLFWDNSFQNPGGSVKSKE